MEISLDSYPLPSVYLRNGCECFLDPVRKKLIPKTFEEEVRQKMIQYLMSGMHVPEDMIEVEVPMTYFAKGEKGRADILVYSLEDLDKKVPILIIECKAPGIYITDRTLDQVHRYEEILASNAVIATNGKDLIMQCWNESTNQYENVRDIPSYKDLCLMNNLHFENTNPIVVNRKSLVELGSLEEIENEYKWHFGTKTPSSYWTMIANLNELLWDSILTFTGYAYDVVFLEDLGLRYTNFTNPSGIADDWLGDYRSFVIQDYKGSNQIVSFAIMHGYLVVALDDYKKSHNSLQFNIHLYVKVIDNVFYFEHNGKMSGFKNEEVIDYIISRDPHLVKDNKIYLGSLNNTKEFMWEQTDIQYFFGRMVKYALLRDELRQNKKQNQKEIM